MTPSERHELFAAGLALILPDPVLSSPQSAEPGKNLTPEILWAARNGNYHRLGHGIRPYYFEAKEYCGHLLPVVEELWRICYLDG